MTRFRKYARVGVLRCRVRENTSRAGLRLFKLPVSFLLAYEHKENSDLGHGGCQALAGGKLHKTQITDNTGLTCKPARVKGIGPRMSKASDVAMLQDAAQPDSKCVSPDFCILPK